MKSQCKHTGCITLLGRYSNPDYCHLHTKPHDQDEAQLFVEKLAEPGVPPRNHVLCECGRTHKTSTSCVCKARPAPTPWGRAA